MNQYKMKVQPVKKLMRNIKEVKTHWWKNLHEIYKGDKRIDKIGGDDVASVQKSGMGSSTYYINEYDDLVCGFDVSTFSGGNVYYNFENKSKIITEYSIIWVNTNERIWEGRVIKIPYSDLPQDSKYLKLIWVN